MSLRLCQLVVAGLLFHGVALAGEPPTETQEEGAEAPEEATTRTRPVRIAPNPGGKAGLDVFAPAEEPTEEGVWTWVARMEGEIPSPETVEAVEERRAQELDEASNIDGGTGVEQAEAFYTDPEAAVIADPLHLDQVDPSEFDIPIDINDDVRKWVRYFTGPGRKYFQRYLARATKYQPMMLEALKEKGLPSDLVYLSMIESGYNPHAYSSAHAVGLWQFIPSTGRLYKLRVDWWVDERRDPELSTDAALAFLSDLHDMWGDWRLAWASYNAGPGRVRKAIARSGSKDFWTMAAGPYLHTETDNYVPKIMAAAIVAKHPERYDFTEIAYEEALAYDTTTVEGSVELGVLAKCAGVDEETFRGLNPHLRRWATPTGETVIRLPTSTVETFIAALAEVPVHERLSFVKHTVRRGETLSGIAAKYGVSVDDIVRVNRLSNADRIFSGLDLVIPMGGADVQVADAAPIRATDASPATSERPSRYTVRSGDSLSGIAARYGVATSDLQSWNSLTGSVIHPGQVLELASTGGSTKTTYTVSKGDSLIRIAARYGVTVADLQSWNHIRNASTIYVGQVLTVFVAETGWREYTVRSGDSLIAIAGREGCTVADLQAWNALTGSVIHPGDKLKIRK